MSVPRKFQISRSPWVRPLLVLFTATASRSWVELGPTSLRAQYGWYRLEIPYSAIVSVKPAEWPWYAGIGWRTNFRSVLGLIGSYDGIVQFEFQPAQRTRLLGISMNLGQLFVSLEDQDGFLQAANEIGLGR